MNERIHAHMRRERGYKFDVAFDGLPDAEVQMDEPRPLGGSEAPSATMMLSAAIGHCLTSSLLFCMQKSRGDLKDIETDVETELRRNERGRWRVGSIKVRIKPCFNEIDSQKMERCKGLFEDFCIVTASIREGIKVDVEVVK
ncbi:MAG: OsmC family protein [Candidatus Thermoplasmatota archaeon]|nr:OsmC family protein [Candidatus Thermoplasmatota archaeon]